MDPEHLRLQSRKDLQRIQQHSPVLGVASISAQHPLIHLRERIPNNFLGVSAFGGADGRGKCFEFQDPARSGEEEPETSLTVNVILQTERLSPGEGEGHIPGHSSSAGVGVRVWILPRTAS